MRFDTRSARKAAALATAIRVGEACDACGCSLDGKRRTHLEHKGRPTRRRLCPTCSADWQAQRRKHQT